MSCYYLFGMEGLTLFCFSSLQTNNFYTLNESYSGDFKVTVLFMLYFVTSGESGPFYHKLG